LRAGRRNISDKIVLFCSKIILRDSRILDAKIRIPAVSLMLVQINARLDGNISDKILLSLLKILLPSSRIFRAKKRILARV
jgi:hypothetical protein